MFSKILFSLIVLLGPMASNANESSFNAHKPHHDIQPRSWNIRADLGTSTIYLLSGAIGTTAGVDYMVSPSWTVGVTSTLGSKNFDLNSGREALGGILTLGARAQYFFKGANSHSWYLAPFLYLTNPFGDHEYEVLGFAGGYKWQWANGLNLQLGLGPSLLFNFEDFKEGVGFLPTVDISLGYAF